jgi:hypothetical protein
MFPEVDKADDFIIFETGLKEKNSDLIVIWNLTKNKAFQVID